MEYLTPGDRTQPSLSVVTPYLKLRSTRSSHGTDSAKKASSSELKEKLALQKLHLGDGHDFGGEQSGWLRITFFKYREQIDEGLKRIVQALYS